MPNLTTTPLTGDALKQALVKSKTNWEAVMILYLHTRKCHTPTDVYYILREAGVHCFINDVRRSIDTLTQKHHIIRLMITKKGMQGDMENYWQVNRKKHPVPAGMNQQNMFL